jgi:transcriptional regulator with XRE-family HTH domain
LAARLGWAQSKVSRIETGRQTATADDVIAWAGAIHISPDVRDDLVADLRAVRFEYATWKRQLRRGAAPRQRANLPLEARAGRVQVFTHEMVPGLLQTADYARYVFDRLARLHGTPNDVEDGVRVRMYRQRVLYDSAKRFRFLLTEASLRYRIAPVAVHRGQLDRLLNVIGVDTIDLAVIPFSQILPVVPSQGFTMFDDSLVLVEITGAELAFRDAAEIALYRDAFERLWEVGVGGNDLAELVQRAIEAL